MRFLRDLFMGIGNQQWDLGRLMAFAAFVPMFGSVGWNAWLGQPVDLMALGGGLAAVITAAAALIAAKDLARTNALSSAAPPPPEPPVAEINITTGAEGGR